MNLKIRTKIAKSILKRAFFLAAFFTPTKSAFSENFKFKNEKIAEKRKTFNSLYSKLNLGDIGLNPKAFSKALSGLEILQRKQKVNNPNLLCIVDFTQSSNSKRFYIINLITEKVLFQTYVAHGRNSGEEFAKKFSNSPNSFQSSPGFYITGNTYAGKHGLSLRLQGIEYGKNHLAEPRGIVVHGADYVSENFINQHGRLGRSQGCPALPLELTQPIIKLIKNGACFYIHA